MQKTIPATHDIRAVDFDDVKTFFEEIEKDTNLLHADELKFARNFLGKFGATIPPFKEEEDDDDDDDDMPDLEEVNETTNEKWSTVGGLMNLVKLRARLKYIGE